MRSQGFNIGVESTILNKPGRVSNERYHMTDWLPTFVTLACGSPSMIPDLDGFDIWDSVSNGSPSPRKEVFIQADLLDGEYVIRWHQYKLLHYKELLIETRAKTDDWYMSRVVSSI